MRLRSLAFLVSCAAGASACTSILGSFDYDGHGTGGAAGTTSSATSSSSSSATSTSSSGTGGATCAAPCTSDASCHSTLPGPCSANKCDTTAGCCTTVPVSVGTPAPAGLQTTGDCQVLLCDGTEAGTKSADDPTDVPAPSGQCQQGACSGVMPTQPSQQPVSGACTVAGGKVCGDPSNAAVAGKCVGCNTNADCVDPSFPVCGTTQTCVAPACGDGIKDGSETDKDCGGSCSPCTVGRICAQPSDCQTGVCSGGTCQAPTCFDGVKNGNETDKDCGGGSCVKCGFDKGCMASSDCVGNICQGNLCAASCSDAVQDGTETDVDCGGTVCSGCAVGKTCVSAADCQTVANGSVACSANKCALTCSAGWGNCSGLNDCATNLLTSAASCGTCGNTCSAYCLGGSCNDPVAVAVGGNHTCAILADGSVWCWGFDADGELGDGMTASTATPKRVPGLPQPAKAIAAGALNACAILSDQTLWCWGDNSQGNLGLGNTNAYTGPQKVLPGVASVAIGQKHACALLSTGALDCWGFNSNGQVGNGTFTNAPLPTQVLTSVSAVTAGLAHTCAISGGSAYCWGRGSEGELGNGLTNLTTTPGTAIAGLSGVLEIGANALGTYTCARTSAGSYCWGLNSNGQLGDGTTSTRTTPPTSPINLPGATRISVGGTSAGAITPAGLYMWGGNALGTLGDGTTNDQPTPVKITFANATSVSIGYAHSCALTTAHKLYCWGGGFYGQLGNGMQMSGALTPTPVLWP